MKSQPRTKSVNNVCYREGKSTSAPTESTDTARKTGLPLLPLERDEGLLAGGRGGHLLVLLELALERGGARVTVEVLARVLALVGPVAGLQALLAPDRLRRGRAVNEKCVFFYRACSRLSGSLLTSSWAGILRLPAAS